MCEAVTDKKTPVWQLLIVALFAVTMLFACQIRSFFSVKNRFDYAWTSTDAWALILVIVTLALMAVAISIVLDKLRWHRCRRVWGHLFVLVVISGAIALLNLATAYPRWLEIGWLFIALGLGFSLGHAGSRLVEFVRKGCLIFSPLVPIVFGQLLMVSTWECPNSSGDAFTASEAEATPVFVFVFDGWPFPRITDDDREFLPQYENVRKLSAQSFNFANARSPYHCTYQSLPRIIYQTDNWFQVRADGCAFATPDGEVPATDFPSVFTVAKKSGYNTAMVGFGLSYQKMLGDQVDFCRTYRYMVKKETLLDRMTWVVINNCTFLTDQFSMGVKTRVINHLTSRHYVDINKQTRDDVWWLIDHAPANSLCVTHWPLPHAPYIFDSNGSYAGPFDGAKGKFEGSEKRRDAQLLYQDEVVGQVVGRLKTAGKFDDALLVLTSDHGWSRDQETNREVPLIIKLPGQKTGQRIEQVVCNNQINAILDAAMRGELQEQTVLGVLEEIQLSRADQEVTSDHHASVDGGVD